MVLLLRDRRRSAARLKEPGRGTGLGLAVVRQIIESYDGKLTESRGLAWHAHPLDLPAAARKARAIDVHRREPAFDRAALPVLCVDVTTTSRARSWCGCSNAPVTRSPSAHNADAALTVLATAEHGVLVTDLRMPGMEWGRAAFARVRKARPGRAHPGHRRRRRRRAGARVNEAQILALPEEAVGRRWRCCRGRRGAARRRAAPGEPRAPVPAG